MDVNVIDKLRETDYNILVINALNGAFAIQLRKKYPKARIICAEIFTYFKTQLTQLGFEVIMFDEITDNMRFDLVSGNPPYKLNGDKSYYIKFIEKSRSVLSDDGQFHFIIPNRFLSPSSKASKSLSGWLDVSYVMPTVDHHFPGIGTSIGVVGGKVSNNVEFKPVPFIFPNEQVVIRSLSEPTPIVNTSILSSGIVSKVVNSDFEKLSIHKKSSTKDYVFVEVSYCRYRSTTPRGGEKTLVTNVNFKNGIGGYIDCQSDSDAKLTSWFLSRSKLGRFIIYCFANTSFATSSPVHHKFMPKLPVYTLSDDSEIYKLFKLTTEEIEYVESVMK